MSNKVEELSNLEHQQWMEWSKEIAKELEELKVLCYAGKTTKAIQKINKRLNRWEKYWVEYGKLDDETKEFDRVWARKVMKVLNEKIR